MCAPSAVILELFVQMTQQTFLLLLVWSDHQLRGIPFTVHLSAESQADYSTTCLGRSDHVVVGT